MTRPEKAKYDTFIEMKDFRVKNILILTPFAAVIKDFDDLDANTDKISAKMPLQKTDETGTTVDKEKAHQVLIEKILENCNPTCSYLFSIGDMTNHNKINYSEYALNRFTPADLESAADIVIKICTEQLLNLAIYKVTALTIAEIATAKATYLSKSNEPAEIKTDHKVNTSGIKGLFRNGSRIVKFRLVKSIYSIKKENPEAYETFINLCHDIQIGVRSHHAPTVVTGSVLMKITDSNTEEPLQFVSIKIVGFPEVYLTDENGMVEIEAPIGTQEAKIMAFDHVAKQISITFTEEDQTINIPLTPLAA